MFGGVPASLLLDLAKSGGAMYQLELDLDCPPYVFVDPEHLTSCVNGHSVITSDGKQSGVFGSEDHPRFRDTRQWLAVNGYIHMEKGWSNGDRVIKPFYFNNVYLDIGDQFPCAGAMGCGRHAEFYNDGKPMQVPNYVENTDDSWDDNVWDDSLDLTEVSFPDYVNSVKDEQDDLF